MIVVSTVVRLRREQGLCGSSERPGAAALAISAIHLLIRDPFIHVPLLLFHLHFNQLFLHACRSLIQLAEHLYSAVNSTRLQLHWLAG